MRKLRVFQFLRIVWRRDAYFHQPESRWTVPEAWVTAGVIVDALRSF